MRGVAVSVFYRKRSWGVCNTPLHGHKNGMRRIAAFVIERKNVTRRVATSSFGIGRALCGVAGGLLGWKILNDGDVI